MPTDPEKSLEELIDRELRRLPPVSAPSSLIPRVWAVVQVAQNPAWWQRPWLAWPLPWQIASVPAFLLILAATAYGGTFAWDWLRQADLAGQVAGSFAWMTSAGQVFQSLANAAGLLNRTVGIWVVSFGLALYFALYLICLAAGTTCYRLALVKR